MDCCTSFDHSLRIVDRMDRNHNNRIFPNTPISIVHKKNRPCTSQDGKHELPFSLSLFIFLFLDGKIFPGKKFLTKKMPPKKKIKENLKQYNCCHYEHPNRVVQNKWKCPKCGCDANQTIRPLDGGSCWCGNKKCGEVFHWCAFKDNFKGGYECDEGPFHELETAPPLQEIKRPKVNSEDVPVLAKKTPRNTYRCLDYKHPDRVCFGNLKCPKCNVPQAEDVIVKDGGSALCPKCNCRFHWCAFKGDYEVEKPPNHILDEPPTLEKEDKPSIRKLNSYDIPALEKKTKTETQDNNGQ